MPRPARPRAPAARIAGALVAAIALAGAAGPATGEPVLPPRAIDAPVARLLPRGAIHAALGATHRGGGFLAVAGGLAGLAEVELAIADDIAWCAPCDGAPARAAAWPLVAGFKIGVDQGAWAAWQPALALGFRTAAGGRPVPWDHAPARLAEGYAAATLALPAVRVTVGAALWATHHVGDAGAAVDLPARARAIRPLAALEVTPPFYPRTTLLADLAWEPELGPTATRLRWLGAWGIRYQALTWGSIELLVRHRQGDDLEGSTVMVRLAAATR